MATTLYIDIHRWKYASKRFVQGAEGVVHVFKSGKIMLGRFKYMDELMKLANKFKARVLNKPFPKGVSLEDGLKAEIYSLS